MKKSEFIEKLENGSDIMFKIGARGYTVTTWQEDGPDIGEWNKAETVRQFKSIKELTENYLIDGKPLIEYAGVIKITDYT